MSESVMSWTSSTLVGLFESPSNDIDERCIERNKKNQSWERSIRKLTAEILPVKSAQKWLKDTGVEVFWQQLLKLHLISYHEPAAIY